MEKLTFRPHHFLCTLCFQGKGYSPNFIRNYKKIVAKLNDENGDQTLIEVTANTDSICAPCPHKRDLKCASQTVIDKLDKGHAEVLNLKHGDTLTWADAKKRLKNKMTLTHFHRVCGPCSWKQYGLCEQTLVELHNSTT